MDFVLREHRGGGAEAFDDGAHERPNGGAGEEYRSFAEHGVFLKHRTHRVDEFLQLAGGHGQLFVVAIAGEGLGVFLLPRGRESDERNEASLVGVLMADLAREPRAHMLANGGNVAGIAAGLGDAFENGGQVANGNALGQQALQNALERAD